MRLKFGLKMGLAICLLAVGTTSAGLIYFYSLVYRNVGMPVREGNGKAMAPR